MNQLPISQQQASFNNLGGKFASVFNVVNLKQTLSVMRNSSLIVKSFCVCILIGYVISFKKESIQYLSVIPGNLLPPNYYAWTLFTHSFIEYRLLELIFDWFIILTFTRMLEPLWGIYECVQFYFIITVVVAISTSFFYLTAFAVTFNELLLFDVKIHGLGGLLGGFCVAIKQIMPDTIIFNVSFMRLRQDHLPLMLILLSVIVSLIKITGFQYPVMVTFGVYIGWLYLRFFQKHKNGTRGDSSSTFTFSR
jgi:membrane associated rhomboid family serine protease